MTLHRSPADEPFFREWNDRRPGERRSLARARALARRLGVPVAGDAPEDAVPPETAVPPVLTVVGSKGKGTAALYAAATLTDAGLRTGLLTSPGVLSNRERVRVDGLALSPTGYEALSARLAQALDRLGPREPGTGYLSPTGLFTLSGVRHMLDAGCEALVLEAGMGGRSDEVSLFDPAVVAVAAVFGEHRQVLGDDIAGIARDKAGVIGPGTRAVLSVPQRSDAWGPIATAAHAVTGSPPERVVGPCGLDEAPAGLSGVNACLGHRAALRLLQGEAAGEENVAGAHVARAALRSVRTPGRLSVHADGRGRRWVLDAAIDATGVAAALAHADRIAGGAVDTLLVSFPAEKDVTGLDGVLEGRDFVPVRVQATHITYPPALLGRPYRAFAEAFAEARGPVVAALGTWSFMGAALDRLGVDLERVYGTGGR